MIPNPLRTRIEQVFSSAADNEALLFEGAQYSWADFASFAQAIDTKLNEAGIGADMPVGLLLRNRPAALAALVALLVSNRCAALINPMQPLDDLIDDIQSLKFAAILGDAVDWEKTELVAAAQSVGSLAVSATSAMAASISIVSPIDVARMATFRPELPGIGVEMLTSGTTGKPKRIPISYDLFAKSLIDGARTRSGQTSDMAMKKKSPAIIHAPLMHASGIFAALLSVLEGRPMVLLERFKIDPWLAAVRAHRPKSLALQPPILRAILDAKVPCDDLASVIAIHTGSAPLSAALQTEFEDTYSIPLLNTYGATEWAGAIAAWTLADHQQFGRAKTGSVGRARADTELRIANADSGDILPAGETGILEIKTARTSSTPGWTRTSDLASIDADGFLYIHGRADDVIIRGGFKVDLGKVKDTLELHPAIKEAAVVGLDDARLGQVPVAAFELVPGVPVPTLEEIDLFARQHLIAYQVPTRLLIVDELPRTVSYKISRPSVRALFAAPGG
jgi:long-chain acyl-CoA synthetase